MKGQKGAQLGGWWGQQRGTLASIPGAGIRKNQAVLLRKYGVRLEALPEQPAQGRPTPFQIVTTYHTTIPAIQEEVHPLPLFAPMAIGANSAPKVDPSASLGQEGQAHGGGGSEGGAWAEAAGSSCPPPAYGLCRVSCARGDRGVPAPAGAAGGGRDPRPELPETEAAEAEEEEAEEGEQTESSLSSSSSDEGVGVPAGRGGRPGSASEASPASPASPRYSLGWWTKGEAATALLTDAAHFLEVRFQRNKHRKLPVTVGPKHPELCKPQETCHFHN